MSKRNCKCGSPKPYRRAYSCLKCWDTLPAVTREKLLKERKTLRVGGNA